MRAVYKYDLTEEIIAPIEKFLHIEMQDGVPCAWAIVDTDLEEKHYTVLCSGTGWPLLDPQTKDTYVGTLMDGPYVWHFFIIPVDVENTYTYNPSKDLSNISLEALEEKLRRMPAYMS